MIMDLFDQEKATEIMLRDMEEERKAAIEQARQQAIEEGKAEGIAEGIAEGRAAGLAAGLEEGRAAGLEAGLEEGRAAGLNEGERKSQIKIARNLKETGADATFISTVTGLTIAEVEQL